MQNPELIAFLAYILDVKDIIYYVLRMCMSACGDVHDTPAGSAEAGTHAGARAIRVRQGGRR